MTEEIHYLNTDLKELFVASKIEELMIALDKESDNIVQEITLYNYDIIKNYFDSDKYSLLFKYIKFVAFSSFLCDYSAKRQLIENAEYEGMSYIFTTVYNLVKQQQ